MNRILKIESKIGTINSIGFIIVKRKNWKIINVGNKATNLGISLVFLIV